MTQPEIDSIDKKNTTAVVSSNAHLPPGSPPVDLLKDQSLPGRWRKIFNAHSQRVALVRAHDGSEITYAELDAATQIVAGRLHRAGLRPGHRILMSAPSSTDLITAHVAALRLGLVVVPMNVAYTQREVEHIVDDVRPEGAIIDDYTRHVWLGDVSVVCRSDVALPEATDSFPLDGQGPDDLAMIAFTSGTTGLPKGAMLSHGNLLASMNAVSIAWRWTHADRLLLCLPLFHLHGLGVGIHGTLANGASATILPRFDADQICALAAREEVSMFFGVPTMFARLDQHPDVRKLANLRLCISGSAPLPADLHRRLRGVTGNPIVERYGMTETVMNISNPYIGERKPGTVGLPLPGVEVRLEDKEIQLRGPHVFSGYWERSEATNEAFTSDGWFRTGDLASVDADGYYTIVGRTKDLIITGGFNVYPAEVEEVLRTHTGVADVAVAGVPSEEWGEDVVAWVVALADSTVNVESLELLATRELARFKRPRRYWIVDDLPRNHMGKVLKKELREP